MSFATLFLLLLIVKSVLLIYLSWRQERSAIAHKNTVPEAFQAQISLDDHQKAANYTAAKQQLSRLSIVIDSALLCLWLIAGGLAWLDETLLSYVGDAGMIVKGMTVIGVFAIINAIFSLPLSLYVTFVLEERFGFNRTTFKIYLVDLFKSTLLGTILGGGILVLVLWLMAQFHDTLWWVWVWGAMVLFNLIVMAIYPRYLAPIFNKFTPLEAGELKDTVANLLKRCGFNAEAVFIMDGSKRSSHGNAYFTGLGVNKRVVFFDTLIETLNNQQIEAVLAHELGHASLKHIPKMIIASLLKLLVGLWVLSLLLNATWFYEAFGVAQTHYNALLLFMLVLPVFTFFLQPLSNLTSRKYEFEADEFAKKHSNSDDLVTALLAMYSDNAATLTPDKWYSAWHDSHPPASERITALQK